MRVTKYISIGSVLGILAYTTATRGTYHRKGDRQKSINCKEGCRKEKSALKIKGKRGKEYKRERNEKRREMDQGKEKREKRKTAKIMLKKKT